MNAHALSREELKRFRSNPWVRRVSESGRIYYTKAFIAHAFERKREGYTPKTIFTEAGIPLHKFRPEYPKERIKQWLIRRKKAQAAPPRHRGRPTKRPDAPEERLRFLEAQVAYLRAENAFLAELRAQRAE